MRIASSSLLSGCCSAVILDIIEATHECGRLWLGWRMFCSHHRNAQLLFWPPRWLAWRMLCSHHSLLVACARLWLDNRAFVWSSVAILIRFFVGRVWLNNRTHVWSPAAALPGAGALVWSSLSILTRFFVGRLRRCVAWLRKKKYLRAVRTNNGIRLLRRHSFQNLWWSLSQRRCWRWRATCRFCRRWQATPLLDRRRI